MDIGIPLVVREGRLNSLPIFKSLKKYKSCHRIIVLVNFLSVFSDLFFIFILTVLNLCLELLLIHEESCYAAASGKSQKWTNHIDATKWNETLEPGRVASFSLSFLFDSNIFKF